MFFVVGCGLLAFGMMGTQIKFRDAILLPVNILKSELFLSFTDK
jgi:hypothetical protein